MSTHNIRFYGELPRKLSFNFHQIPSLPALLATELHYLDGLKFQCLWKEAGNCRLVQQN